jgi:hypothetical protein
LKSADSLRGILTQPIPLFLLPRRTDEAHYRLAEYSVLIVPCLLIREEDIAP